MTKVIAVERWRLTAEFDPVAEVRPASRNESGFSEAGEFYGFCVGFLAGEVHERVCQEGDTVTVSLSLIDPMEPLFAWIVAHSSPRSVTLTRTEPR